MNPEFLMPDTDVPEADSGPPAAVLAPPPPGGPAFAIPPPPAPPHPPTAPAGRRGPRAWPALAVAVALVAGAGGGAAVTALRDDGSTRTVAGSPPSRNSSVVAKPADVQGILAKVSPAVVYVRTQALQPGRFFPSRGAGTGIILTPDGEVLTNAHVVDGATSVKVTLANETQARDAQVVGADTDADLAVLRIAGASGLPTAELGRSADLKVGDDVIAIGNALNLKGGFTVTEGIVSALDRSIPEDTNTLSGLIQTDAAINPGNSGGPLVNSAGQVVGINTATSGDAQNIGFAIAIDNAKPVIERLRTGGGTGAQSSSSPAGFLGVTTETVDSGTASALGLDVQSGALVGDVSPGTPAASADVRQGDVIVGLDGTAVTTSEELATAVRAQKPGDRVTLHVARGQQRLTIGVTLAARPAGG